MKEITTSSSSSIPPFQTSSDLADGREGLVEVAVGDGARQVPHEEDALLIQRGLRLPPALGPLRNALAGLWGVGSLGPQAPAQHLLVDVVVFGRA